MNKNDYVVTCSKCGSSDIKYKYRKTSVDLYTKESKTPVKCLSCGYETVEIKK